MKRRWHNLLAIASFAIFVPTVALWVRSRHQGQSIERVDPHRRIVITSMSGVISASRWDGVFLPTVGPEPELNHAPREVWQKWMYFDGGVRQNDPAAWAYQPFRRQGTWWQFTGFDAFDRQLKPMPRAIAMHDWLQPSWTGRQRSVTIPYWALTVAFATLPAVAFARVSRRRLRARAGLCPTCGYDLRASSDRCPECGATVARRPLISER